MSPWWMVGNGRERAVGMACAEELAGDSDNQSVAKRV